MNFETHKSFQSSCFFITFCYILTDLPLFQKQKFAIYVSFLYICRQNGVCPKQQNKENIYGRCSINKEIKQ